MEIDICKLFKAKQRKSNTATIVDLTLGTILILGALILIGLVYPPDPGSFLSTLVTILAIWTLLGGLLFLVTGLFRLSANRKAKQNMEACGVDEAAFRQAEQEMRGQTWRYRDLILTSSWVLDTTVSKGPPVLYPLRAVTAFWKKTYSRSPLPPLHGCFVKIMLSNGAVHQLPCYLQQQDDIMAVLAWCCPQANARPPQVF